MSSVVISGDTSGAITLSAPAVSGTNTATLPAATGTVMVSGNMPAFSAYAASNQTGQSSGTWTKAIFATEEFDTNNNFTSSTFTPTVAGYYQISGELDVSGTGLTYGIISIYKNGSIYKRGSGLSATQSEQYVTVSSLVYLNGSTDYVEIYGYTTAASGIIWYSGGGSGWFNGTLVRGA
jgi:hypothetical protein